MSGKGSRQRRVEAHKAARDAVYKHFRDGKEIVNPYTSVDPRMARIFDKSTGHFFNHYMEMEALVKEMEQAYGSFVRVRS